MHSRILQLTKQPFTGNAVVYVMSRDQRTHDNHALLAAQQEATTQKVPLFVFFALRRVPNRSQEHYKFMLEGLKETASNLSTLNIAFTLAIGNPYDSIMQHLHETAAGSVYFDFNPLVASRHLAKKVAKNFSGSTYVVDTHNVVSAWTVSDKQEFAAHTMRRKIHAQLENFVVEPPKIAKHPHVSAATVSGASFEQARQFIVNIPSSGIVVSAKPGEKAAKKHLSKFINEDLETYALKRNDIANDHQSGLSPYLHFGQISALRVTLNVLSHVNKRPLRFDEARLVAASESPSKYSGMNALFEEMIVRKELSDNFCFYTNDFTSLASAPAWAQQSLKAHSSDTREFTYTRAQWEHAQTHDDSWNAAQNQLRKTGKIHGYMRMYWAKKMLEWSSSPETALKDCIYLNDKYSIDGGDPNGYVGILWSIAGLHDRPWTERSVYGKIRYMNAAGLKRKFDVQAYHDAWNNHRSAF